MKYVRLIWVMVLMVAGCGKADLMKTLADVPSEVAGETSFRANASAPDISGVNVPGAGFNVIEVTWDSMSKPRCVKWEIYLGLNDSTVPVRYSSSLNYDRNAGDIFSREFDADGVHYQNGVLARTRTLRQPDGVNLIVPSSYSVQVRYLKAMDCDTNQVIATQLPAPVLLPKASYSSPVTFDLCNKLRMYMMWRGFGSPGVPTVR